MMCSAFRTTAQEVTMLKIGWDTREITPDRPAMVQGQKHRRVADEAMDPLTLTALAIESEEAGDCAVLVSCDLAFVSDGLLRAARERVADLLPDLPPEKIIACGTHTHTSMVVEEGFYERPDGDVMSPAECEALVADRMAVAIAEAWQERKPRALGRAFGHAVVGHNRYAVYADGRAQMYGNTDTEDFAGIGGYEDHSLDMLFTWDPDGNLAGVAPAIPCPSQVDEGLEVWSADYWHEVREELRRRLGQDLPVLALCSAAGDQSPHFLVYGEEEAEMRSRRGLTERQEIARRVGDAVESALRCSGPVLDREPEMEHTICRLELSPLRITPEDREWAIAEYERCMEQGNEKGWWPERLQEVLEHSAGEDREPVEVEVHVLRLGEMAIATNPFEMFLDYGLQIKARSPAAQTLTVQLTCGRGMYLPTEAALDRGGYGAMPVVCEVGPEGGRTLVRETLSAIRTLFA
jgi:hypothetical protein